jgi:hypothetical protein
MSECPICFESDSLKLKLNCCNQIICIICFEKVESCPFCRQEFFRETIIMIEENNCNFNCNRTICFKLCKLCFVFILCFILYHFFPNKH